MDADVQAEFDRMESRITKAAKVVIWIGLAIAVPVSGGAIVVYAQVGQVTRDAADHDKSIEKLNGTRDKVLQIEPRLEAIEKSVGQVQVEQKQQRDILEEIRREVKK